MQWLFKNIPQKIFSYMLVRRLASPFNRYLCDNKISIAIDQILSDPTYAYNHFISRRRKIKLSYNFSTVVLHTDL